VATQTATLAGGCFWCLEPIFADLRGVKSATPGYAGGTVASPSYEEVCSGRTGHAEAVQIVFDPDEISYRDLLEVFFAMHDPTTRNRQGADVGSQYRSAVFVHDDAQRRTAEEVLAALARDPHWEGDAPVTEVTPLAVDAFCPAEAYHRDYFNKNPGQGYCRVVIAPKVQKFRRRFADRLAAPAPTGPAT